MPIDADAALRHLSRADAQFKQLVAQVGPFVLKPRRESIFVALVRSIVYQQLSGKAASTIHRRLLELLPGAAARQPAALLKLTDGQIRSAGISRPKLAALRDLADRTHRGLVPDRRRLARMSDAEVIERLVEIRGVGRWTAEMILIFWLGRPDVLPVLDLGIRKGFALTYNRSAMPTPDELANHGAAWSPFRSVAAWYLWRVVDLDSGGEW